MTKEEFYKNIKGRVFVQLMDNILLWRSDSNKSNMDIINKFHVKFDAYFYAIDKIREYVDTFDVIAIKSETDDGRSVMASIHTNRFLNEGGFTQEFDDIMEDNTLEGSIKKNQAKLLQRQVKYYWIPILISAISLIISLSVMIFK